MGFLQVLRDGLIPFSAVVLATTVVALVCHYFTSGWPSALESLLWDFVAVLAACGAFVIVPLSHIFGSTSLPWSGKVAPNADYWALVEIACCGSVIGFVAGAMVLPLCFKRMGWWD